MQEVCSVLRLKRYRHVSISASFPLAGLGSSDLAAQDSISTMYWALGGSKGGITESASALDVFVGAPRWRVHSLSAREPLLKSIQTVVVGRRRAKEPYVSLI